MTELTPVPDDAHSLPDGGWVVLRDHTKLSQGDREDFLDALPDIEAMTPTRGGLATFAALIAYAVTAWSYGPLPSEDPQVLRSLPIAAYDAIREACEPFRLAFFPQMTATPAAVKDESSPTGPSAD